MLKYILKRLGISVIILLGVSVIIYSLVRMMPNDFVDRTYLPKLNTSTLTEDDIDNFKELYGLTMPEAYLEVKLKDGFKTTVKGENGEADKEYDLSGVYTRKVKIANHDRAVEEGGNAYEFVAGKFKKGDYTMELSKTSDGMFYRVVIFINETETVETVDEDGNKVTKEKTIRKNLFSTGQYKVTLTENKDFLISISEMTDDFDSTTNEFTNALSEGVAEYTVATGWQKLGSIFSGYFTWIGNLLKGDLGKSFKYQRPVAEVIGENMWISFSIALIATILQFLIAIPLGITSATHQYTFRDYTVTVLTMVGISLPTYFFAAIVVKVFAVDLGWFPPSKLVDTNKTYDTTTFIGFFQNLGDMLHHLILPIFVNVILSLGGLMRYTRTNMLEVLSSDYIRTARAKGLSEKTVIYKHAFRNTLIPLATLLAGILPSLFGGMMITEKVFSINGIGGLAYQALYEGDVPFVMGYNMFLAVLTVLGTLLSDIMYSVVDPRVKLGD